MGDTTASLRVEASFGRMCQIDKTKKPVFIASAGRPGK